MSNKPSAGLMPALYSHCLSDIQAIGRASGYAIAVHGSMQRDIDVIAVPWTRKAVSATDLVDRLCERLDLAFDHERDPVKREHGRVAYSLLMGGACYMDLSVMPRFPCDHFGYPTSHDSATGKRKCNNCGFLIADWQITAKATTDHDTDGKGQG